MFIKGYIVLKNGKKIKAKKIIITRIEDDTEGESYYQVVINLPVKWFGYFSSDETSIKSGFFRSFLKKSMPFFIDEESIPEYQVVNNKLIIKQRLEEI